MAFVLKFSLHRNVKASTSDNTLKRASGSKDIKEGVGGWKEKKS